MDRVDLHLHTWASDGKNSPQGLVQLVGQRGLRAIAITDHDCVDGIEEALRAGEAEGVEVIPGIELSVQYKNFKDVHILGYYLSWKEPRLQADLAAFQRRRLERGEKMVSKINLQLMRERKAGLDYREILREAKGAVGRPHLARKLVEKGYAATHDEAFSRYLLPNNVSKAKLSPQEAIALIHEARGLAVLAHPNLISTEPRVQEGVIRELKGMGLEGIEAIYPGCRPEDAQLYRRLSPAHDLLITGGSDYHGDEDRGDLGLDLSNLPMDYPLVERLKERYRVVYGGPPASHFPPPERAEGRSPAKEPPASQERPRQK